MCLLCPPEYKQSVNFLNLCKSNLMKGFCCVKLFFLTDGFKTYDSLVDLEYKKHYRVRHGKNEFAKKNGRIKNHINGIENFWGLAKVRLYKFRGMDKKTFYLHLKECEFRFNYRQHNLCLLLLNNH